MTPQRKRAVERFSCELGGCGDPDCCGNYATMEVDADGDYVRFTDYDALEKRAIVAAGLLEEASGLEMPEELYQRIRSFLSAEGK